MLTPGGRAMDFADLRLVAARTPQGERFAAVWTVSGASVSTPEGEVRTGARLDRERNVLMERIGACSLQPEIELRRRLVGLGLPDDEIAQKFESARAWMTTIVVTERPERSK
jgi:hypothetical protein